MGATAQRITATQTKEENANEMRAKLCAERGEKKPWARISAPRLQRDDRDQKRRVQGWGCHFAGRRLHQKAVATSQSNKLPGVKEKNQWNCTFHRFRNWLRHFHMPDSSSSGIIQSLTFVTPPWRPLPNLNRARACKKQSRNQSVVTCCDISRARNPPQKNESKGGQVMKVKKKKEFL